MKTFLLLSILILAAPRVFSQEENAPAEESQLQEGAEVPVQNLDPSKVTKPRSRLRAKKNLPPNESSSFVGDPDSIDPLNPNKDNIKDDAEPVLEDIRDVLNAKKPKKQDDKKKDEKKSETAPTEGGDGAAQAATQEPTPEKKEENPPPPVIDPTPVVEDKPIPPPEPVVPAQPVTPSQNAGLSPDDPDLALEKKFHDIYKKYNINPTSEDAWAAASGRQTARLYEVQKGDTLWTISKILFGDPNFWPKLWALNKQGILNPHFINPKMKIYFYEGDEENSPTLTIGEEKVEPVKEEVTEEVEKEEPEALAEDGTVKPAAPKLDENTVIGEAVAKPLPKKPEPPVKGMVVKEKHEIAPDTEDVIDPKARVERKPEKKVSKLPPSLPESFNKRYYFPDNQKAKISIDLGALPKSQFFYKSDLILTDIPAETEVKIGKLEDTKDRCRPGRVFKDIEFSGSLLDEYDIYEKLGGIDTADGYKYTYRFVGTAKSRKEKYLAVVSCDGIMTIDFVILPKNRMKELATQAKTDGSEPTLIGGPEIRNQFAFATLHYGFVDFGSQNYDVGQEFKLVSEQTDLVNGEIKVIEKFGSFAVVVFTNTMDHITIGDKVLIQ